MSGYPETYAKDLVAARSRGHLFFVATKDGTGMRWRDARLDIADLDEAMRFARGLEAYEVGVFVQGGVLYWTSVHPGLLNSTVLTLNLE